MRQFLVFTSVMVCVGLFIVTQASSQQPATTPAAAPPTTPVTAAPAAPATATPPVASTPVAAPPVTTAPTTQVVAPVAADPTLDPTTPAKASEADASEDASKKIKFDDTKYVEPTYANLARLYWALGILDINNNRFVDNFLAITECNMYLQYIYNDLEWQSVRQATRDYLRQNYKAFPQTFKIIIPLYLGKYNADDQYFEVNMDRSAINSVRNIETIYYTKTITCGQSGDLEGYPRNLVLYLNRPFMLPKLPVERELARLYLDEANSTINTKRTMDANRRAKETDAERIAFLELMFRVHSFKENRYAVGGFTKAVVYAEMDYIRVYADYEKQKLLYEKDMFEEEGRKRRKRDGETTNETLELPSGPIFGDPKKTAKPATP